MVSGIRMAVERLERQRHLWSGSILILVATASAMAACKPLWFDELLTLNIARLATLGAIPTALADGADVQPLLGYLLTRASLKVLGETEIGLRLPSLVGFSAACWAVFWFTRRRAGAAAAACATAVLGLTEAFPLAFEARPYGLWLAFTALALVSWTEICHERNRRLALLGLGLGLAAGVASHYYAVLGVVPIVIGEMARTWRRRQADAAVWGVVALSLFALVVHLPLVRAIQRIYSGGFWSPAQPIDILGSYLYLLSPALLPALSVLILWTFTTKPAAAPRSEGRLLFEESAALIALAALPFIAVPLALAVTKAFVYRYTSPALIALSILFGLATDRIAAGRRAVTAASALVLLAWFVAIRVPAMAGIDRPTGMTAALQGLKDSMPLPIVVTSPILFLQEHHYSPSDISERLCYVSDPDWALAHLGTNSPDLNLTRLPRWAPVQVEAYSTFLEGNPNFLLWHRPGARFEWITARLESEGKRLREVGSAGSNRLLRCCD